jgi:excisionase family DNA binding protein
MNDNEYLTPREISRRFGLSTGTLRHWAVEGKVRCIRPNGNGRRLYEKNDVLRVFGEKNQTCDQVEKERIRILYARVSSPHQSEDLKRQCEYLQSTYPDDEIITDIGSGLNWKRKGLETILDRVHQGNVAEIVVAYKDRLCRFAYELIEWICKKHKTRIVVLNPASTAEDSDRTKELSEDLLAVVTVFVAKNNGLRSSNNRKIRKAIRDTDIIEETTNIS